MYVWTVLLDKKGNRKVRCSSNVNEYVSFSFSIMDGSYYVRKKDEIVSLISYSVDVCLTVLLMKRNRNEVLLSMCR